MKQQSKRLLILLSFGLALCACKANETAAHTQGSQGLVEGVLQQQESQAGVTDIASDAETQAQTAPPTAVLTPDENAGTTQDTTSDASAEMTGVHPTAHDDIDVDLTMLSSSMVYVEVLNIMNDPLSYIGMRIRMKGEFALFLNEIDNLQYYACIITDATACCANGFEFVREGDYTYPEDYPAVGDEIIVDGVFEIYEENGLKYIHLTNARMEIAP